MIDKPVYIIIAVYCVSFAMLGAQYLADSYGITLRAPDGTPIRSSIIDYIQIGNINAAVSTMSNINNGTSIIDAIITAAYVGYQLGWELFLLLFGFKETMVFVVFEVSMTSPDTARI